MDFSLTGSGYFLPIIIIGIVIVGIIAAVLLRKWSKNRLDSKDDTVSAGSPSRHRLDYQPQSKPIPVIQATGIPAPQVRAPGRAKPKDIDLTSTRKSLTESLEALVEKYSLTSFTIATADGLLFGSSGGNTAQEDAATCSERFKNDPLATIPGIAMFGYTYKGSDLIGIIRANNLPPGEIIQQIATDTKVILNRWI